MNYDIRGGSRKEKKLVEAALWFAKNELLPRIKVLDIEIVIGNFVLEGACIGDNKDREFEIQIKRGMSEEDILTTVFHEFTHVKQFVRDEILDCDKDLPYLQQPHEIEAYEMQEELFDKFKLL
jgi:hypothetical protein